MARLPTHLHGLPRPTQRTIVYVDLSAMGENRDVSFLGVVAAYRQEQAKALAAKVGGGKKRVRPVLVSTGTAVPGAAGVGSAAAAAAAGAGAGAGAGADGAAVLHLAGGNEDDSNEEESAGVYFGSPTSKPGAAAARAAVGTDGGSPEMMDVAADDDEVEVEGGDEGDEEEEDSGEEGDGSGSGEEDEDGEGGDGEDVEDELDLANGLDPLGAEGRYNLIARLEAKYGGGDAGGVADDSMSLDSTSHGASGGGGEGEGAKQQQQQKKRRKKKKRTKEDEYYNTDDSFIDDSELQERQLEREVAQSTKTKIDGFFVNQGEVEIAEDSNPADCAVEGLSQMGGIGNGAKASKKRKHAQGPGEKSEGGGGEGGEGEKGKTVVEKRPKVPVWVPNDAMSNALVTLKAKAEELLVNYKAKGPGRKLFPTALDVPLAACDAVVMAQTWPSDTWNKDGYHEALSRVLPIAKTILKKHLLRITRKADLEMKAKAAEDALALFNEKVVTKCVEIGWEAKYVTWKADDDMHKAAQAQAQAQAKEKEGELSQGPGLSQENMSLSGLSQATVSQEASQGEVMNPGGTQTAEEATDGAKESVKDATKEGAKKKAKDNGPKAPVFPWDEGILATLAAVCETDDARIAAENVYRKSLSSCDLDVPVGDDDTDELKPKAERDTLLKRMESMWPLKSMARRKLMYQIGAVKRNGATAAKVGSQSTLTQEKDKGKDKLTSPKQATSKVASPRAASSATASSSSAAATSPNAPPPLKASVSLPRASSSSASPLPPPPLLPTATVAATTALGVTPSLNSIASSAVPASSMGTSGTVGAAGGGPPVAGMEFDSATFSFATMAPGQRIDSQLKGLFWLDSQ